MKLKKKVVSEILSIDWLGNCGKRNMPIIDSKYLVVKNIKKVRKDIDSILWENVCLENRNQLTVFLAFNKPEIYNNFWNDGVDEIKQDILPEIINNIEAKCQELLIENAVGSIQFDIVNTIMTLSCRDYFHSVFYEDMLKVYKSGHLPCGWKGGFNRGKFEIF